MITERIDRNDPFPGVRPQPEDMLEDAALGGAQAVRQSKDLGTLEVGKKADLLVVDTLRAHLVPAGRFLSAWIHNGQGSDIESSMIDGQFVMRDRKVLTVDEAAIVAEADKVGRRIWSQVKKAGPIPIPGRHGREARRPKGRVGNRPGRSVNLPDGFSCRTCVMAPGT